MTSALDKLLAYPVNLLGLPGIKKYPDGVYRLPGKKGPAIALPIKRPDIDWEDEQPDTVSYTKICLRCFSVSNIIRWIHRTSFTWLCKECVHWLLACRRKKQGSSVNLKPPEQTPRPSSYGPEKRGRKSRRAILVNLAQKDKPTRTADITVGLSRRVVFHHLHILQGEGLVERINYSPAIWQLKPGVDPLAYSLEPCRN